MIKILIGEPNTDIARAMEEWFLSEHYNTRIECTGWRIQERLRDSQFDLVILASKMPGMDGISIVQQYRLEGGCAPVFLISDLHDSEELQIALDAGADDYLVHPIELANLSAKIRAALRRPLMSNQKLFKAGPIILDVQAGSVTRDDVPVHLHPMEFKLLHFFLKHPNQIFNANALAQRVWRKDYEQGNDTVRTHIRTLRQKLDSSGSPSIVTTVRGLGYKSENHPLSIQTKQRDQALLRAS